MRGGGLRRPGILGRRADAGTLPRAPAAPSRLARGRGPARAPRGPSRRRQGLVPRAAAVVLPPVVSRGRRDRLLPAPAMSSSPPGGGGRRRFVPAPAAMMAPPPGQRGSRGFLARDGTFPGRSRPSRGRCRVRPARIHRLGSPRGVPLPGAPADLGARTAAVLGRAAATALPPPLAILLRVGPQPVAVDLLLLPLGQPYDVVRTLLLVHSGLDDDGARRLALG